MINKDIQKQEEKKRQKELRELERTNPERADKIKKAIKKNKIDNRNVNYFLTFFVCLIYSSFWDSDYLMSFFICLGVGLILATIIHLITKSEFSKTLLWSTFIITLISVFGNSLGRSLV